MRLRPFALACAGLALAAQSSTPVLDPIPGTPVPSGLTLRVDTFAVFPKAVPIPEPTDPRLVRTARINYLGEIPDGSGRMFVPDINGPLYIVTRGTPSVYLDLAKTFAPDFFSGRGLGQGFAFVAFHPAFARNAKFYTVHTETGDALTRKTGARDAARVDRLGDSGGARADAPARGHRRIRQDDDDEGSRG